MRTIFVFFSFIIIWTNIQAQSGSLILKYSKKPEFQQEITRNGKEGIRIQFTKNLEKGNPEKTELLLKDITTENYQKIILAQLGDSVTAEQKKDILQYLKESSLDIMLWLFSTLDDGQPAGKFIVKDKVEIKNASTRMKNLFIPSDKIETIKNKKTRKENYSEDRVIGELNIKNVEVEFKDGFLEQIVAIGATTEKEYRFSNLFGIGFSTSKNYRS